MGFKGNASAMKNSSGNENGCWDIDPLDRQLLTRAALCAIIIHPAHKAPLPSTQQLAWWGATPVPDPGNRSSKEISTPVYCS